MPITYHHSISCQDTFCMQIDSILCFINNGACSNWILVSGKKEFVLMKRHRCVSSNLNNWNVLYSRLPNQNCTNLFCNCSVTLLLLENFNYQNLDAATIRLSSDNLQLQRLINGFGIATTEKPKISRKSWYLCAGKGLVSSEAITDVLSSDGTRFCFLASSRFVPFRRY